jgi:hypothetical protein
MKSCTRTDSAIRWVVFHAGELLGIAVPLLLAVSVAAWFGLLAVVTGAWWVVHEVRDTRRQREIRAAAGRQLGTRNPVPSTDTGQNPEPWKEARS